MSISPETFSKINVADSCSVWNILSSLLLYQRATEMGCSFSCTEFVRYECLYKRRTTTRPSDDELQRRLKNAIGTSGQFRTVPLDLADLQDLAVLRTRKRLGAGELSSLVLARRTQQAFITDDQKARHLAEAALPHPVQTTPQLLGWLVFTGGLADVDVDDISSEHESLDRPLRKHFQTMKLRALELRLKAATSGTAPERSVAAAGDGNA